MFRTLARRARPLINSASQHNYPGARISRNELCCDAGQTRWLPAIRGDHVIRSRSASHMHRLLSTSMSTTMTPPPADYSAPTSGATKAEQEEIERLPLPPGVSGDKTGLYELDGTAKDWNEVSGDNAVVAIHGPEELWTPVAGNAGASGGKFAVIAAGGTQHKVCEDDVVYMNRVAGDINEEVWFDKVLLVGAYDWSVIGKPLIGGAFVTGVLEEQTLSGKVMVSKFKKRKGYKRRQGHRQRISRVRIKEIRFEFPAAERISPYEVKLDPKRPTLANVIRRFL